MKENGDAEKLKRSINLVEFIQHKGITLKKQGKGFMGLCPFHKDTNPSFSVDPGKNLWGCFGCGKGGDVFTFLEELEQLTFAQALEELRSYAPEPWKPPEKPRFESPGKPVIQQEILNRVVEHYHQTFYEDTRGLEYLRDKRNIHDKEIYETFKIGFANGSIFKMLPKSGETLDALKKFGIITAKGREFFHNHVVFPIFNEDGSVTEIYGRAIDEGADGLSAAYDGRSEKKHLYLPGPHRGVYNFQAAKRSRELFLTEKIIDALSLYQAGFRDVIPLYGTNGLTEDHRTLFSKYATSKLHLIFDSDEAGVEGCRRLAGELLPIECLKVTLPVKDVNDFFQAHTKEDFEKLIAGAEPITLPEKPEESPGRETPKRESHEEGFTLTFDKISYHVRLIPSCGERFRVTIRAFSLFPNSEEKSFVDTIDLYSHRSRQSAINQISKKFSLSKDHVEKHFLTILDDAEMFELEKARRERESFSPKVHILSEEEKTEALSFLSSPSLVQEFQGDLDALGYVGEDSNKLLAYLVGVSRKLERPLSMIISSSSGSGKSRLAEVIESLTPPEDVILFSRLSPQALGYMEKDFLKQKLLIIEERKGSEAADYSIRTLQTRRKLTQGVVIKDPSSGRMYTKTYTVEGPIAYIETTTSGEINPENSTRCFELYLDETKEQTEKVHETQRYSRTRDGLEQYESARAVTKKHQNAQRLLRPLKVVIPYAPHLTFPSEWLRTRRDNERFLCLIDTICFLHQHQREEKKIYENGKTIEYIEATIEDYRLAYDLAKEVLIHTLHDLSKPSRELLSEIINMVEERAGAAKRESCEIFFSRRDLREYTKWSDKKVRQCLSKLIDLEYLQQAGGSQGKTCLYQLPGRVPDPGFSLHGILSPGELEKKMRGEAL